MNRDYEVMELTKNEADDIIAPYRTLSEGECNLVIEILQAITIQPNEQRKLLTEALAAIVNLSWPRPVGDE